MYLFLYNMEYTSTKPNEGVIYLQIKHNLQMKRNFS